MILSRAQLAQLFTSTLQTLINPNRNDIRPQECRYHEPPAGSSISNSNSNSNFYQSNPTVFGRILDGTLPCSEISETDTTLTFHDRTPKAPLHALIIPKTYIRSVYELDPTSTSDDNHNNDDLEALQLVKEMKQIALETIQLEYPDPKRHRQIIEEDDYILCFHVPPFISVGHLHLHVLAPKSEMKWQYRYGKYQVGSLWCTSVDNVLDCLEQGKQFV